MDLKTLCEVGDWFQVAQNLTRYRVFVNSVMRLLVQKIRIFLMKRININLSRKAVFGEAKLVGLNLCRTISVQFLLTCSLMLLSPHCCLVSYMAVVAYLGPEM
jgi:hypothetical protein